MLGRSSLKSLDESRGSSGGTTSSDLKTGELQAEFHNLRVRAGAHASTSGAEPGSQSEMPGQG